MELKISLTSYLLIFLDDKALLLSFCRLIFPLLWMKSTGNKFAKHWRDRKYITDKLSIMPYMWITTEVYVNVKYSEV